jgi:hypothetical protein
MFKRKFLMLAAAALVMFSFGCETLDEAFKPPKQKENRYVLSLHQIVKYPRAKNLEQEITTLDGRTFWINMNQFFHSRHIEDVKLIPRKGEEDFYDIALKLDYNGILKWIQLTMQFKDQKMALMIDGHFYKFYVPDHLADADDEWVMLTGPFDKVTADGIKKFAKNNYVFFNPSKQGFAQFIESLK